MKENMAATSVCKRKSGSIRAPFRLIFLSVLLLFASCTVKLVPEYDQAIVDNLSNTATEIFQLFATISGGTDAATFNSREDNYNALIGKLEAQELQINARPVPSNRIVEKVIQKANAKLTQRGASALTINDTLAPSAQALEDVKKALVQMKQTDKTIGLKPSVIQAHENAIRLFLDQALTYEKFLKQ